MDWPHRPALGRLASVWVALSLVVIAAAMSIYALDQSDAAALVRSLVLPGSEQVPDTQTYDAAAAGAVLEAATALVLAAAVVFFSGRARFAISALWSLLTVGTGAWIALGVEPYLVSLGAEPPSPAAVQVGPIELSMVMVGMALLLAAAFCLAGCIVGWFAAPPEPRVARLHMPPPTHQA